MKSNRQLISMGAWIALCGFLLSGFAGTLLVEWLHPQPAWESPRTFAEHNHWLQSVPFIFGFLLLGGMLLLSIGHYFNADEKVKSWSILSMLLTVVFVTLIFLNYIIQTTYSRSLALNYSPANDTAISMFSMSNPKALSCAIEMWGYAILGVATSALYPYYSGISKLTAGLLVLNGLMSLAGAVFTAANVGSVFSISGLVSYALWNLLMIVIIIRILRHCRSDAGSRESVKRL